MASEAELLALAERCEAAGEPDAMIDLGIYQATTGREGIVRCMGREGISADVPAYTASLDAALSLVPTDDEWSVHRVLYDNKGCPAAIVNLELPEILAATPALALCAAALRARAATMGGSDERFVRGLTCHGTCNI
jgi:hypothetical protein